jgi:hypothetical protein
MATLLPLVKRIKLREEASLIHSQPEFHFEIPKIRVAQALGFSQTES